MQAVVYFISLLYIHEYIVFKDCVYFNASHMYIFNEGHLFILSWRITRGITIER